jgi:threonine dehydrogenase-like Zn-dependent dehydrogenase
MRAVRIEAPGDVVMVELPRPEPGPGEVSVRVDASAICATDRRLATLGTPVPRIPGHEVAGTLEDGTAVGVQPNVGCGRCASCAQGLENRCPDHVDIGIQRDGGLAEWIVVPESHVVPLDAFAPDLAPSIEPLACCLHAVGMLDVGPDEPAVVVGAGTLGVIGMWALQSAGARVAVVQRSEARRRLAAELGADAVLEPGADVEAALGSRPRAALVTVPSVEALSWALESVDVGGRVHAFAGIPGGAPIDANLVHYRHLRLVGSTGSTVADYRRARDIARSGSIPLGRLPSRTIALEEAPQILLDPHPDPRTLRFVARP